MMHPAHRVRWRSRGRRRCGARRQQRSLWDSARLPSDQLPDGPEGSGPSGQHGFSDTAPFSPRMHAAQQPKQHGAQPPAAAESDQAPSAAAVSASPPADAGPGQATIPYDWAISIDERGESRVDSGGGRLIVGGSGEGPRSRRSQLCSRRRHPGSDCSRRAACRGGSR